LEERCAFRKKKKKTEHKYLRISTARTKKELGGRNDAIAQSQEEAGRRRRKHVEAVLWRKNGIEGGPRGLDMKRRKREIRALNGTSKKESMLESPSDPTPYGTIRGPGRRLRSGIPFSLLTDEVFLRVLPKPEAIQEKGQRKEGRGKKKQESR